MVMKMYEDLNNVQKMLQLTGEFRMLFHLEIHLKFVDFM